MSLSAYFMKQIHKNWVVATKPWMARIQTGAKSLHLFPFLPTLVYPSSAPRVMAARFPTTQKTFSSRSVAGILP